MLGAGVVATLIPTAMYLMRYIDPMIKIMVFRQDFDYAKIAKDVRNNGHIAYQLGIFGWNYMLWGEQAGKWLLVQEKSNLLSGGDGRSQRFRAMLKGSIIDQDFAEHAKTRRLLAPAFKAEVLRQYLPRMARDAHKELEYWIEKHSNDSYLDLQDEIKQLTLRFAFTLLIGADFGEDRELAGKLVGKYKDFVKGIFPFPFSGWNGMAQSLAARQRVEDDVIEVIRKRKEMLAKGEKPQYDDPLWLMLNAKDENGNGLSDEELANECVLLVFAGHETTARTITAFCVQLLLDPSLFDRLRFEQDALAKSHPLEDGIYYTNEHLKHMPLLDATFREVERLYNVVPAITRRARTDLVYRPTDGGAPVLIKAGSLVSWNVTATNRDPAVYENPDAFRPDRWLDSSIKNTSGEEGDLGAVKVSNFKLATFGAGHRVCLGMQFARMEMLAIGGLLVRDYDWMELKPGAVLVEMMTPQLKWIDGVPVNFKRRVQA